MKPEREHVRILVIDDEKHIRQSFADYLEDRGFEAITAENGRQGMEEMKAVKPDLVFLDLRMPEIDGLEVLSQAHDLYPDLPMIVVSGANHIGDVVRAIRLGACDYLEKPIKDFSILDRTLEKALNTAQNLKDSKLYKEQLESMVKERVNTTKDNSGEGKGYEF